LSARLEHAARFAERLRRRVHRAERERAYDGVERRRLKRQILSGAGDDIDVEIIAAVCSLAANDIIDAANKWYWRANRERLDVEALRDSMLFVAGTLEPKIGGESEELTAGCRRRTVYGRVSRFKLNETLQLFDFPSPSTTSEKRDVTHVPLQRLFFLNGELVAKQSAALADRIEKEGGGSIEFAYSLLFQRKPTDEERRLNLEFLRDGGWKQLAQVLLSSNEFLFVD